jgi:hypothetical protein
MKQREYDGYRYRNPLFITFVHPESVVTHVKNIVIWAGKVAVDSGWIKQGFSQAGQRGMHENESTKAMDYASISIELCFSN